MFIDEVIVELMAGNGGDGCMAFKREKYVPMGGPFGGNGGKGSDIIFEVDEGLNTLLDLRYKRVIKGTKGTNGQGSAKGKAIVAYAKQFVGKQYVWGGSWNGELPYTGTDCSGFVQGVFRHNGINLSRTTYTQWADKGTYTLVHGEIKAGDLVMYDGHVAILTGNGNEIVHAKGSKWGIVVDSDYKSSSSHAILGIMRINGVN